jgi:hypothetical protein
MIRAFKVLSREALEKRRWAVGRRAQSSLTFEDGFGN